MSERPTPPERSQRTNQPSRVSQRPPAERIPAAQNQSGFPERQPSQGDPTRAYQAPPTQSMKRAPGGPPPEPAQSGLVVPWWGFVLVILAVAGITCGLWGLVIMNRGDSLAGLGPSPTPIFVVITSTPTLGPPPDQITETLGPVEPTQPAVIQPTIIGPTPEPSAIPITVGSTVEIFGTEGVGVKIRQGPGTTYSSFLLAQDGDIFRIVSGPTEADGYIWWEVIDPNDSNRAGWMVEDFMAVVTTQ